MRRRPPYVDPSGALVVVAAIALWEIAVRSRLLHYNYLPAPSDVLVGFHDLLVSGVLLVDVAHTLGVAMIASALAMVIGIAIGLAVGLVPAVNLFVASTLDFLRTIPTLALIPVALLIWGPQFSTEVIVATYAATWPILVNTAGGVKGVNARLYDVARTFQLTRTEQLAKIVLPSTVPAILVGGRLAVVSALVVAIIAEMFLNPEGIGWGLITSEDALRPERMWTYAVAAGLMGYVVNAALVAAVDRALPGGRLSRAGS